MKALHRSLTGFLTLLAIVGGESAAPAQVVAPNPAPTIITTAPYNITRSGYYQLGANLTYRGSSGVVDDAIITINASNVTLDFAGHYISGPASNSATAVFGVFAQEQGNLNIINGTVTYCYRGIYLSGNGESGSININQRVNNMLVSDCYFLGIGMQNVTNADITNNRVSLIGGSTVSNTNLAVGISVAGTAVRVSGNSVTSVTLSSNPAAAYGITFSGPGVAFGNQIFDCYVGIFAGIYQQNITSGCTTPFTNGTDGGLNVPSPTD